MPEHQRVVAEGRRTEEGGRIAVLADEGADEMSTRYRRVSACTARTCVRSKAGPKRTAKASACTAPLTASGGGTCVNVSEVTAAHVAKACETADVTCAGDRSEVRRMNP
nr:hypothetical protein [Streptomyces sp. BR123]